MTSRYMTLSRLMYDSMRLPERLDPFSIALTFSDSPLPILISGGPGTGKKCLAIYIHTSSQRKGPFLTANLQGLDAAGQGILLFGDGKKTGLVEQATQGTLYLDEISSLAVPVQQRLAAMLSHGSYEPWPAGNPTGHSTRILASTRGSISGLMSSGNMYGSFLFNLGRVHIKMPPAHFLGHSTLKLLADHWLADVAPKKGAIHEAFWNRLDQVRTEGDLHELKALVQRAYLLARSRSEAQSNKRTPISPPKMLEEDLNEALATGLGASEEYRILEAFETALKQEANLSQTKLALQHPEGMAGTDVVRLFVERAVGTKGKPTLTRLGTFLDLWKTEFPALRIWLKSQQQRRPRPDN